MISTDRRSLAAIFLGLTGVLAERGVSKAQQSAQEILNDLEVTSTGDVTVDQAASGEQGVFVNGVPLEDGVHQTTQGQIVVNGGRITSTGDVRVSQSASGNQTAVVQRVHEGMQAEKCNPGHVLANPDSGQLFYQRRDCCYYPVPTCCEQQRGCEGRNCK